MIFDLRSIMVALAFMGVSYCLFSLLVVCTWRAAIPLCRNHAGSRARVLFGLRIFPLAASALVTLVFAVPAFLLLESNAIDEDLGTLLFSICALLLFGAGLFRAWNARRQAVRVVAAWSRRGLTWRREDIPVPVLQVRRSGLPLLLAGIFRPRVLISDEAVALLTPSELHLAALHEVSHLRSRDNLKKLIAYAAPFPGMRALEQAWQEAAEFAADETAVHDRGEALDLAGALIKLAELVPLQEPPAFTTGLVATPALVSRRVERLLAWNTSSGRAWQPRWWQVFPSILVTAMYVAAHYQHALLFTHRVTEWFIR